MKKSDKSLVQAHCKGDPNAFEELVRRHGSAILGYLIKMTGSIEQAEDMFQETFKIVHEKGHTLKGENFRSWVFTIATRVAVSDYRKAGRLQMASLNRTIDCNGDGCGELSAITAVDDSPGPVEMVFKAEQKQAVKSAIEQLPEQQRATLVLAYYQKLSYRQVAEVLDCSIGAVKTHMHRALKSLARTLPDAQGGIG